MSKQSLFMMTACPTCKEFGKHLQSCPKYPDTIKDKIRTKREEIRWYRIELKMWKQGKDITGRKITLLKKGA